MKIELLKGDITLIAVDAIVNAANSRLAGGGGVDGAIHRKGGAIIAEECAKIRETHGGCPTGSAVYTNAGDLPAKYVIHTVGPIWRGGMQNEPQLLASSYTESLKLAETLNVETISFPNISTGVYGYPKEEAATVAIKAVKSFSKIAKQIKRVIFVCFDDENYNIYNEQLANS
ncbi:MAG TPA: O-acetyl-ADP-ribose deacetylase [Salinivirgaceae bacterium]|nr:O-acetyl-ADP-ribose deacetylase [Salinivirgaceae bacterium]HQA75889.1 O-acetyl-ADP-ribose deacetylase [Salinivirgaceae bacterium]